MKVPALFLLSFGLAAQVSPPAYFVPSRLVPGIGLARRDLSAADLEARTNLMIESQTFAILRDSRALDGARRITGDPKLHSIFVSAAAASHFPETTLEAVAYLESWGDPTAESPSGPKGIMQVSESTARLMGLKIVHATRYHVTHDRVAVKTKSKRPKYRVVTHKQPYDVVIRDDRLSPARAIPAAAEYLASMQRKFGALDWAIFAYHCGQGCAARLLELARAAVPDSAETPTVARMFFCANPVRNREIYETIQKEMQRDYSPTYWFRVMRAEQLLALYRRAPGEFESLAGEYRSDMVAGRAPHRLTVWISRSDLLFHTSEDIRSSLGERLLVTAPERASWLGYTLMVPGSAADREDRLKGAPAAIGALMYVAYETRRLYDAMEPQGAPFAPLPVTSLVEPEDYARQLSEREALSHISGQVFDIDDSTLPASETECLRFVLDDLGWAGYLGFVDEGASTLHIGAAPSARDFFASVYAEAFAQQISR